MSMNCININHPEFIELLNLTGLKSFQLELKIQDWVKKTGNERFPTLEELGFSSVTLSEQIEDSANIANEKVIKPDYYLTEPVKSEINVLPLPVQEVEIEINKPLMTLVEGPLKSLNSAGMEPVVVGGAVRDALLNKKPKDIDIEVYNTTIEELEEKLSEFGRTDTVGKAFGIIKFRPFDSEAVIVEDEIPTSGLLLPIGISGSGKSTYVESLKLNPDINLTVISPDQIRKELTGDISDQSRNPEVFKIAVERTIEAIAKGGLVVFDATNLSTYYRNMMIGQLKKQVEFDLYYKIFESNPEVSKSRILLDVLFNKERAKVTDDIIDKQYEMYLSAVEAINAAKDMEPFDFSVPRRENKVGAGYTGFETEFDKSITKEEAATRRDFTWNSIMYNPVTKKLYDYYGGISDLINGIVRHVSPKFAEDPLRILRAMQFQARMGHKISDETYALMKTLVDKGEFDHLISEESYQAWAKRKQELVQLKKDNRLTEDLIEEYNNIVGRIPRERIVEEWRKWATKGKYHSTIFEFLDKSGLGNKLYPELMLLRSTPQDKVFHPEGDVEEHTKQVIAKANEIAERENLSAKEKEILLLSALFHDISKPETTKEEYSEKLGRIKITAKGHEPAGEPKTKDILRRMGYDQSTIDVVGRLIGEHLAHATISSLTSEKQKKSAFAKLVDRLKPATVEQLILLMEADMLGRNNANQNTPPSVIEFARLLEEYKTENAGKTEFTPILKGKHLLDRGVPAGKLLGDILKVAKEAQLNLDFTNEPEAIEWLNNYLSDNKIKYQVSYENKQDKKTEEQKSQSLTSEQKQNIQELKQIEPEYANYSDELIQEFLNNYFKNLGYSEFSNITVSEGLPSSLMGKNYVVRLNNKYIGEFQIEGSSIFQSVIETEFQGKGYGKTAYLKVLLKNKKIDENFAGTEKSNYIFEKAKKDIQSLNSPETIQKFKEFVNEQNNEISLLTLEDSLREALSKGFKAELKKDKYGQDDLYIWHPNSNEKEFVRITKNQEANEYTIHKSNLLNMSKKDRIDLLKIQSDLIPENGRIVNYGKSTIDGVRSRLNLEKHGWKVLRSQSHNQGFKENISYEEIQQLSKDYDLGDVLQNNTNEIIEGGIKPGEYYIKGVILVRESLADEIDPYQPMFSKRSKPKSSNSFNGLNFTVNKSNNKNVEDLVFKKDNKYYRTVITDNGLEFEETFIVTQDSDLNNVVDLFLRNNKIEDISDEDKLEIAEKVKELKRAIDAEQTAYDYRMSKGQQKALINKIRATKNVGDIAKAIAYFRHNFITDNAITTDEYLTGRYKSRDVVFEEDTQFASNRVYLTDGTKGYTADAKIVNNKVQFNNVRSAELQKGMVANGKDGNFQLSDTQSDFEYLENDGTVKPITENEFNEKLQVNSSNYKAIDELVNSLNDMKNKIVNTAEKFINFAYGYAFNIKSKTMESTQEQINKERDEALQALRNANLPNDVVEQVISGNLVTGNFTDTQKQIIERYYNALINC